MLTATVSSGDAADVIWSSENENIATVTSEGIVKCGTQTGTTKIKCKGANQTLECTVTSTAKIAYTNSGSSNVRLNGGAAAYNNPTIPVGFSAIDTEYATWTQTGAQTDVNKGLVIMDNRGNQFVWIPVENAIYDSSNANASKIPTSSTKGSLNGYNYTPMAINVSGNYKGILYDYDATGGAYLRYPSNTNYQGTSSDYREPARLANYDTDTAKPTSGLNTDKTYLEAIGLNASTFASEIQNNYDEMVNKVATYGGFYVGRYETSYDKNVSKVASIAGATSTDALKEETYRWYGLYKELRDFKNDGNVKSSMIWGSQYDAMMNWMASQGITVASDTPMSGTAKNTTRITGNPAYNDKLNNVYDIYGNSYEWTLEASNTGYRAGRGGYYDCSFWPSNRIFNPPVHALTDYCSRLSLYISNTEP